MELERVAGQEALSTFIAVPSSRPLAEQETLRTEPPPEEPVPTGTALLLPQSSSTLRWVALVGLLVLLGVAAAGILFFRGKQTAGVIAPDAALAARADSGQPRRPPAKPVTTARLRILAKPPGALVTVDGKDRGVSPVTIEALPAGRKVRVQVAFKGRRPYDQQVELEAGATLILQPELLPLRVQRPPGKKKKARRVRPAGFGTLSVNTDPWSVVYVDGVRVGNTPLMKHRLAAGKHTVKLVNPGKKLSKQRSVIIRKDKHEELSLSLQ